MGKNLITLLSFIKEYEKNIDICQLLKHNIFVKEIADFVPKLMKSIVRNWDNEERIEKMISDITKGIVFDFNNEYLAPEYIDKTIQVISNPIIQSYINDEDFYKRNSLEKINYRKLHYSVCSKIFKNIENMNSPANCFWVQIDHSDSFDQESANREEENSSIGDYLRLCVLSEEALEYDNFIFRLLEFSDGEFGETFRDIFRPYFIEYYVDCSELSIKQKDFFLNNSETWFKGYFISDEVSNVDDGMIFTGAYVYSASPVKYKGKKIVIDSNSVDSDFLNKIQKTYRLPPNYCSNDISIEEYLKEIFSDVIFNKVRIYSVGNGNCVYSYGKTGRKEKRLLYDIGFDNESAVRQSLAAEDYMYKSAINRIRNLKPDCIILSHWDADHYKACAYGREEIFECMWIAPDFKDAKVNAKRLGTFLYWKHKIMFVDRTSGREIKVQLRQYSELTLYVGNNGNDLTKINCEGIAVKHKNHLPKKDRICCLMQGDVSYKSLPAQVNFTSESPYEYLVAPHHGSKMDYGLLPCRLPNDGQVVICCNNKEDKNRPDTGHRKKLEKCYSNVEVTEHAKDYIQFNLRQKNSIIIK